MTVVDVTTLKWKINTMNIAIIGTGLMGQALGERLLAQQQSLTVYNRTQDKTHLLQELGASVATSAQHAISISNISLLLLSDANAINAVLDTIEPSTFHKKILIQMGTISPDESRAIAKRLHEVNGLYLECPVLGSLPEAKSGKLILMAAGQYDIFSSALPLLNLVGEKPSYFGETGRASTVKLAMNQLIAGLTASFSLSLSLIEKEQVNVEQFMSVLRESALYAPTFDKKLDRMLSSDFSKANFPTKHLAKDIGLFLTVAKDLGIETCALEGINELLSKTLKQGLADNDYSSIYAGVNSSVLAK